MNLLLTKLILTSLVILAALWVARRWGDAFGGWLAGLPLTSAPVAAFLAIEHGPAFAAAASAGSVAAVASQASSAWPIRRHREAGERQQDGR